MKSVVILHPGKRKKKRENNDNEKKRNNDNDIHKSQQHTGARKIKYGENI
jgi:hypothetical protein